ncbi:hypothetical protein SNEBB_002789 [Seison nebaliae]|nr:hypothetical protein SNEBB_002789 [Seison nebaliae]
MVFIDGIVELMRKHYVPSLEKYRDRSRRVLPGPVEDSLKVKLINDLLPPLGPLTLNELFQAFVIDHGVYRHDPGYATIQRSNPMTKWPKDRQVPTSETLRFIDFPDDPIMSDYERKVLSQSLIQMTKRYHPRFYRNMNLGVNCYASWTLNFDSLAFVKAMFTLNYKDSGELFEQTCHSPKTPIHLNHFIKWYMMKPLNFLDIEKITAGQSNASFYKVTASSINEIQAITYPRVVDSRRHMYCIFSNQANGVINSILDVERGVADPLVYRQIFPDRIPQAINTARAPFVTRKQYDSQPMNLLPYSFKNTNVPDITYYKGRYPSYNADIQLAMPNGGKAFYRSIDTSQLSGEY